MCRVKYPKNSLDSDELDYIGRECLAALRRDRSEVIPQRLYAVFCEGTKLSSKPAKALQ